MDDNFSKHTYPRATDPALNVWKSIGNVTQNSFTIDVDPTPPITFTPTNAVYTPTTGLMEVTIGNHQLEGATSHTVTDATLDTSTGVFTVTVPNHGFQEGEKINVAQVVFKCLVDIMAVVMNLTLRQVSMLMVSG
ncbi:MAG: hypothetical protein CM15mV22_1760 [Eurybiavirus sp.]|nr:MAG: hypothetical protein CM15mV22_1760 [Eurybiavirus sp.]